MAQRIDVADPRRVHYRIGERIDVHEVPPPCRNHRVLTLEHLAELAADAELAPKPVIWYSPTEVILILDGGDRRDRVGFPLKLSPQFVLLRKLEVEKPWKDQKEFLQTLRMGLGFDDKFVLDKFRKLDWKVANEAKGEIRRDRESLGKSIEAQVQGIDQIPESLVVNAPVYANPGEDEQYQFRLLIEIDVLGNRLQLVPDLGDLDRVVHAHMVGMEQRLSHCLEGRREVPLVYGTP
jgi:hypothetical protein